MNSEWMNPRSIEDLAHGVLELGRDEMELTEYLDHVAGSQRLPLSVRAQATEWSESLYAGEDNYSGYTDVRTHAKQILGRS